MFLCTKYIISWSHWQLCIIWLFCLTLLLVLRWCSDTVTTFPQVSRTVGHPISSQIWAKLWQCQCIFINHFLYLFCLFLSSYYSPLPWHTVNYSNYIWDCQWVSSCHVVVAFLVVVLLWTAAIYWIDSHRPYTRCTDLEVCVCGGEPWAKCWTPLTTFDHDSIIFWFFLLLPQHSVRVMSYMSPPEASVTITWNEW